MGDKEGEQRWREPGSRPWLDRKSRRENNKQHPGQERRRADAAEGFPWLLGVRFRVAEAARKTEESKSSRTGSQPESSSNQDPTKGGSWAQGRDRGREEAPLCREMQNAKLTEAGCDG